ncbi:WYL domain-containing protein [Frankia sp. CNm7]|nr:WYL domain-containing protein [Frankia nepalensis]MBL7494883.1 WYL domain-containing protein [Frankia nepalensis]MBL7514411.1 WYL domain-containing protein [Frankia nepalensis]MBL7518355.1 WYL domain-containing protein [Frankia nepalensis]
MAGSPSRMLRLLSLLQTRRDWPGRVLAERLEISDRTLRRDVDHLRELGYRINAIKGPDGGYRLDAGSELPPLLFDDDQAVALAIALQVASVSGAAAGEAALRALTTVRQVMPPRLRQRIDGMTFTTLPAADTAAVAVEPEVLITVSAAVRAQEVLRFDYVSVGRAPGASPSRRRTEPRHIVFGGGRWYLVAWDLDASDWRVFRLDRVTPCVPTGPRFTPRTVPGGDVHDFVAGRLKGSDRGNTWPCTGEVILELPMRDVTPFVHDGIVEELAPNRCRLVVGSWSWVALAVSIGRFDAAIIRVAPRELGDAFGVLSQRFAEAAAHTAG